MTLRCKPGDLAIILATSTDGAVRAGDQVTVVERIPMGIIIVSKGKWHPVGRADLWCVQTCDGHYAAYADHELLPIRPDPQGEDVRETDEVEA